MVRMPLTLAGASLPGSSAPAISMLLISKTAYLFASLAVSRYCDCCMSWSRLVTPELSVLKSTLTVPVPVAGWAGSTVRLPVTEAPAVVPTMVSSGASALKVARELFESILKFMGSARTAPGHPAARTMASTPGVSRRIIRVSLWGYVEPAAGCPHNSGAGPTVPTHGGRGVTAQPSFHDERVLARVEVVARATADDLEAQAFVEPEGVHVAGAHLEERQGHAARAPLGHSQSEEPLPYPAPPPLGMHREVGDVDLVADLPQTDVAHHALARVHHRAAGDLVLLDFVTESRAGPWGHEGDTLDGEDLIEVGFGHGRRHQPRLHPAHPRRALSSASEGRR